MSGFGSNSNYLISNQCKNIIELEVDISVTNDIVCKSVSKGPLGISFQLNCHSPVGTKCALQQYIFALEDTSLFAYIDFWDANLTKLLGWSSDTLFTFPEGTISSGYKMEIFLLNGGINGAVSAARFTLRDQSGSVKGTTQIDLATTKGNPQGNVANLAPITVCQMDIVGLGDSTKTVLSSGLGSIGYGQWGGPLTATTTLSKCVQESAVTAETANTSYGVLPTGSAEYLSQSFSISA